MAKGTEKVRGQAPADPRRVRKHLLRDLPRLTHSQCLRHAERALDAVRDRIAEADRLTSYDDGRPRQIGVRTLVAVGIVNALRNEDGHLQQILRTAKELPRSTQVRLGIVKHGHTLTYRQLGYLFIVVVDNLNTAQVGHQHPPARHDHPSVDPDSGEVLGCHGLCPALGEAPDDDPDFCPPGCPAASALWALIDSLLEGTLLADGDVPLGGSLSLDGTDHETYGLRRTTGKLVDVDPNGLEALEAGLWKEAAEAGAIPDGPAKDPKKNGSKKGRPKRSGNARESRPARGTTKGQAAKQANADAWAAWRAANPAGDQKRADRWCRRPLRPGPTAPGAFKQVAGAGHQGMFPMLGPDGRLIHSHDPDAREGKRSGTNGRPGETYLGYEMHMATTAPGPDGAPTPMRVARFRLAPAGSDRGRPGLDALASWAADRPLPGTQNDRGYSVLDGWADSVRALSPAYNAFDLHPNQRVDYPHWAGALCRDGGLFSPALPERLHKPVAPGLNATREQRERFRAECDERAQWAFAPAGTTAAGTPRYKGPALRGTLRCPNWPASMRLSAKDHPTSTCKPSSECPCGKSIAVPDQVMNKIRQWPLWGTTAWFDRYGKRGAVEVSNSLIARLGHTRGYVRMFGQARNALLVAFLHVAINLDQARRWRVLFDTPSLDGPEDPTADEAAPRPEHPHGHGQEPRPPGEPPGPPAPAA